MRSFLRRLFEGTTGSEYTLLASGLAVMLMMSLNMEARRQDPPSRTCCDTIVAH